MQEVNKFLGAIISLFFFLALGEVVCVMLAGLLGIPYFGIVGTAVFAGSVYLLASNAVKDARQKRLALIESVERQAREVREADAAKYERLWTSLGE